MEKQIKALVLLLFFCFTVVSFLEIGIVKAQDAIYIRADGSVEGTEKIQRNEDVYTLTGDVYRQRIIVERSNIIIDGNGHTFSSYHVALYGIYMFKVENVTIQNMVIRNCPNGIFIDASTHVTISGNTLTEIDASFPPTAAITLYSGGSHSIVGNKITGNYVGIYFSSSSNNRIYNNNFINNNLDVYEPSWYYPENTPSTYFWDNGSEGNYWSNYDGTDENGDGIGDTPYIFTVENETAYTDNYPLMEPMEPYVIPEFPSWESLIIILVVVMVVAVIYKRRLHSNQSADK